MAKTVTMDKIALKVGASKSLVSKALSGKYGVSEAMRKRILLAAEELGYERRSAAAAVRLQNVTIAVEKENFNNAFYWSKLIDAAVAELRRRDINVYLQILGDAEQDLLFEHEGRTEPDGLLFIGDIQLERARSFQSAGVPIVWLDSIRSTLECDYVHTENYQAAYRMAELVASKGHRNILFLGNPRYSISYSKRYEGLCAFAQDHPELELVIRVVASEDENLPYYENDALVQQLTCKDRPTAIFACNDMAAIMSYSIVKELGLGIPEDISIVGFDNSRECIDVCPTLTTVNVSVISMALEAVRTLIARVADPAKEYEQKTVKADIVLRQSLAERNVRI